MNFIKWTYFFGVIIIYTLWVLSAFLVTWIELFHSIFLVRLKREQFGNSKHFAWKFVLIILSIHALKTSVQTSERLNKDIGNIFRSVNVSACSISFFHTVDFSFNMFRFIKFNRRTIEFFCESSQALHQIHVGDGFDGVNETITYANFLQLMQTDHCWSIQWTFLSSERERNALQSNRITILINTPHRVE